MLDRSHSSPVRAPGSVDRQKQESFRPVFNPQHEGWSPARIKTWYAARRAEQLAAHWQHAEKTVIAGEALGGPEHDATYKDIRVYTKMKNGEYKYWGVRDRDETTEEFWAKKDPEDTRFHDDNSAIEHQNAAASSSNNPSPQIKAPAKRGRPRGTPVVNENNSVKRSTKTSPPVNKNTRRSLASKPDAGNQDIVNPFQASRESLASSQNASRSPTTGRASKTQKKRATKTGISKSTATSSSTKKGIRGAAPRPEPKSAKSPPAKKAQPARATVSSPTSEPPPQRGRPAKETPVNGKPGRDRPAKETPAKGKPGRGRPTKSTPAKNPAEKQKISPVKGNARVTKPKQGKRLSEPSTPKMRTRARGSVQVPGFSE